LGGVKMDMFLTGLEITLGVMVAPIVLILLAIVFVGILALLTSFIAKIPKVFSK
jgi:Na+-transporting methylmalonyl-CoA/oxaloacetate decarboxylase gamma subunit